MHDCLSNEEYICGIGEVCGYSSVESDKCKVFCYGDCFAAPNRSNLYPLHHICIRWYVYLLYIFDTLFNIMGIL